MPGSSQIQAGAVTGCVPAGSVKVPAPEETSTRAWRESTRSASGGSGPDCSPAPRQARPVSRSAGEAGR